MVSTNYLHHLGLLLGTGGEEKGRGLSEQEGPEHCVCRGPSAFLCLRQAPVPSRSKHRRSDERQMGGGWAAYRQLSGITLGLQSTEATHWTESMMPGLKLSISAYPTVRDAQVGQGARSRWIRGGEGRGRHGRCGPGIWEQGISRHWTSCESNCA